MQKPLVASHAELMSLKRNHHVAVTAIPLHKLVVAKYYITRLLLQTVCIEGLYSGSTIN
jgi:hypothetical protein